MESSVDETTELTEIQPLMPVFVALGLTRDVLQGQRESCYKHWDQHHSKMLTSATVTFHSPQSSCSFSGAHFNQDPLKRSELCGIWEDICVRQYICCMLPTIMGDRN